ncbi:MAG: DUF1992 domain-containing protein [Burkholderiaceae bacterium]
MNASLKDLVEKRIAAAQAEGAFNDLPGKGKPLDLTEEPLVPEEVRVGNRILRNAGVVPPEVEQLNEAAMLRQSLKQPAQDGDALDLAEQARTRRRLLALTLALRSRGLSLNTAAGGAYRQAIINRLTGSR